METTQEKLAALLETLRTELKSSMAPKYAPYPQHYVDGKMDAYAELYEAIAQIIETKE